MTSILPKLALGATAALVLGLAATAATAQTRYRGGGFISDYSGCESYWGSTTRIAALARARPAGLSGNSTTDHRLSLFVGTTAYHLRFPADAVGQWVDTVEDGLIGSGAYYAANFDPRIQVRQARQPRNTTRSGEVLMTLDIRNFEHVQGCNVRVSVVMREE